jgi:hypothetical protein
MEVEGGGAGKENKSLDPGATITKRGLLRFLLYFFSAVFGLFRSLVRVEKYCEVIKCDNRTLDGEKWEAPGYTRGEPENERLTATIR